MSALACLDVSGDRVSDRVSIFCRLCQRPVAEYRLNFGTLPVRGDDGVIQLVHTGEVTLIVRCHGEEFRMSWGGRS